jgi:plastocyanin
MKPLHLLMFAALSAACHWSALSAADEGALKPIASVTGNESSLPGMGTIAGKVAYTSDPQHPWRQGRYYIKNAKSGELAEAVVAIARRGLKGPESSGDGHIVIVDQKDFQFTPETVAVRVGSRVKFLNSDDQGHNVRTSNFLQSFNVNMPPGGEHVERFHTAGGTRQPYRIDCVYHNAMRAWVFVYDHPWFQVTAQDGAFRLTDVPPGEYRLEVAHPAGELEAGQTILVKADETVSVNFSLSFESRRSEKK